MTSSWPVSWLRARAQRGRVAEGLQPRDRSVGHLARLGRASDGSVGAGQERLPLGDLLLVAVGFEGGEQLVAGRYRLVDQLDAQADGGAGLEEAPPVRIGREAVVDGLPVEERGLAPGPEGDAGVGRLGRQVDHRRRVAGADRVMGALDDVAVLAECFEGAGVELASPQRGHRLFDGLAGEVVAEGLHPAVVDEQPGVDAVVEGRGVAVGDGLDQGHLGMAAEHSGGVEGVARGARQGRGPGEDDVAHRHGEGAGLDGDRLDEEERVAAGGVVQGHRVDRPVAHQAAHRVHRERRDVDAGDVRAHERADGAPDGVVGGEVVAVRRQDEAGERIEPTGDEPEQVEGGLVGPLEVFEHHHGGVRGRGQLGEHGVEDGRLVAGREGVGQGAGPPAGDVGQRTERPGGEEVIAAAHQHLGAVDVAVDHLVHERRLAGTGLAADEHEVAAAIEPREAVTDHLDLLVPLEKAHALRAYDA